VDFTAFTPEEIAVAVDEAHTWGAPITAHAIGRTGIERCVRAGIDSIEHGAQITAGIAREMKERGIYHVPTISALMGIVGHPEDVPAYAVEKGRQIVDMLEEALRRNVRIGVPFACGTDAGTPHNPHGNAPREVIHMVQWGLPPIKALQAATSNAADLLRVPDVGRVEEGKVADLVLWEADPLEDLDALLAPRTVMLGGKVVAGSN
jgi:imidazolonepropionase-like amidohydrolase